MCGENFAQSVHKHTGGSGGIFSKTNLDALTRVLKPFLAELLLKVGGVRGGRRFGMSKYNSSRK